MTENSRAATGNGWLEASGLIPIVRSLGLAVHPPKLGLAFLAIVATLLWGGLLDGVWTLRGAGVEREAVEKFIAAARTQQPYTEPAGNRGVFATFCAHQRRSLLDFFGSTIPGAAWATGAPAGVAFPGRAASPMRSCADMIYGAAWLIRHHVLFALLFGVGALLIWSLTGGAICRIAAVHFARDERLSTAQALRSASEKLWGGYFLAPLIPLIFALLVAVLMLIGGAVLRIPLFGDVISGAAFFLAILGGFVITAMLAGLLIGGSLFFPAVAVEGSDAFDAFSRGLSYVFSKPWKTVLYAVLAILYVGVCWLVVRVLTFLTLACTRTLVAFGTAPFGWWERDVDGSSISKLELLWPMQSTVIVYAFPDWSRLAWYEHISAFFIAVYVLAAIGLMWAFLASFYFSVATVAYFLLRRDVDGTNLDDIYEEEQIAPAEPPAPAASQPAPAAQGAAAADTGAGGATPAPSAGPSPPSAGPSPEDEADRQSSDEAERKD